MRSCPKSSQVRTVQAGNHVELSDVRPSSDSSSQRSCGVVRSLAKFGQLKPKIIRSCPKSSQVRTAQANNDTELSEV
ncbi:hypothetical protein [Neobacillus cucumis]|uniref:hypothetical protein n=1 Tax=Neobacillus cucumis TaxID=1740721 RepID=UPI0019632558|nr:hypothetical protein [Neobacillus cucumis]MBM7656037.1 hypothetical protein [Neobacillus cucumis]